MIAFTYLGGLTTGGVESRTVSCAGERHIGGLAVEASRADDEHGIAGGSLALVDGHRVAVIEVASSEVVVIESNDLAGTQLHVEGARLQVGGDNGAEHAVVDSD